ncbi:MAG: InlB B-repeat-containing protein [Bacilli bacterium]|nr:InlB B-repeat-containing protein [Bacilli bacterium]
MKHIYKLLIVVIALVFLTGCQFGTSSRDVEYIRYFIDDELVKKVKPSENFNVEDIEIPEKVDKFEWKMETKSENGVNYKDYHLDYTLKRFVVNFYDQNSKNLKTQIVNYGESATAPEMDERLIVTWDKDFTNVTEMLSVNCSIEYKYYYIEFYDGQNKLDLEIDRYTPGEEIELPTPSKEGHEFIGWFNSNISMQRYDKITSDVKGDLKLTAKFNRIDYSTVTLPQASGQLVGINIYESDGHTFYQPILPGTAPQGLSNYDWSSSDTSIATLSSFGSIAIGRPGYVIITGTLKSDPTKKYNGYFKTTTSGIQMVSLDYLKNLKPVTITFKGFDGKVIEEQKVIQGGYLFYPSVEVIEGYKFVGWDKEVFEANEDTTINALYEKGTNEYNGKSFGVIGDSISTFLGYIPTGYSHFYPYPTADVCDIYQTWWMRTINKLGGSLFLNNSYSGSCVAAGIPSDSQNPDRLSKFMMNGQTPEYIIIFMGSNDLASGINATLFEKAYRKMLDELLKLNPEFKFILCTLPENLLYKKNEELRIEYNDIIEKISIDYEQKLVDLEKFSLVGNLVDSAHPNKTGMKEMSEYFLNELLK